MPEPAIKLCLDFAGGFQYPKLFTDLQGRGPESGRLRMTYEVVPKLGTNIYSTVGDPANGRQVQALQYKDSLQNLPMLAE